jgi:hypothetical protein
MKTKTLATLLFVTAFAALACNIPIPGGDPTPVAPTETTAPAEPTVEPTAEPTEAPTEIVVIDGTVEGSICYPSEGIPSMTAYFENVNTLEVYPLDIAENQSSFSIDLPTGDYIAMAWLPGFSYGGSYSEMVPCGLQFGCEDHTPIVFTVFAEAVTAGVDICDWYGPIELVPTPSN